MKLPAMIVAAMLAALPLAAQDAEPIADNSFLIEEAYNQDPGVVQHIQTFMRSPRTHEWLYTFTQEWPVASQRHQLSYTIPVDRDGVGSVAVNYRYQLISTDRVAFAPRISVLTPSRGEPAAIQGMLPLSTTLSSSFVAHWNLGATAGGGSSPVITAGQSVVWLARTRFNVLVETIWTRADHTTQRIISPGVRWSYNLPHDLQIVPGIAFPISHPHDRAVLLYLSFEHPFRRASAAPPRGSSS